MRIYRVIPLLIMDIPRVSIGVDFASNLPQPLLSLILLLLQLLGFPRAIVMRIIVPRSLFSAGSEHTLGVCVPRPAQARGQGVAVQQVRDHLARLFGVLGHVVGVEHSVFKCISDPRVDRTHLETSFQKRWLSSL